ncbi:2'-5' RNA ligase family protein [Luteimonas arsenica]|uniref:2'-5' RNA ligase family protein n=1 Tax=Luteimonas arsenica TaxID=1586242 RepID=UPI001055A9B1|nr:2'-5' RNA ligase family protein [Luteimonas arsenica]
MSRALFPGWRPDADGRERLAALAARLRDAHPEGAPRLQPRRPDQWHATLCFIGYDLLDLVTPALHAALADVAGHIPPHAFTVERMAYWPQSGVVVALPHDCPALQALCDATRGAIRRCGIRPLQVTTQPHVTLAYLDRHLPGQPWLDGIDCGIGEVHVDRFELLFNPGGRYEPLAEWPLTGTALPVKPEQAQLF